MASDPEDDEIDALRKAALATLKPKTQPIQQVITSLSGINRVLQDSPWHEFPVSVDVVPEHQYQPEPLPEPDHLPSLDVSLPPPGHGALPLVNRHPVWQQSFNNGFSGDKIFHPRSFPSDRRVYSTRAPHRSFGDRGRPIHDRGRNPRRGYISERARGFFGGNRGRASGQQAVPYSGLDSEAAGGNLIVINPKTEEKRLKDSVGSATAISNNALSSKQQTPAKSKLVLPQDKYHLSTSSPAAANETYKENSPTSKPRDKFSRYNDSGSEEDDDDDWLDTDQEGDTRVVDIVEHPEINEDLTDVDAPFEVEVRKLEFSDNEEDENEKVPVVNSGFEADSVISDNESIDLDVLAEEPLLEDSIIENSVSVEDKTKSPDDHLSLPLDITEEKNELNNEELDKIDESVSTEPTTDCLKESSSSYSSSSSSSSSSDSSDSSSDDEDEEKVLEIRNASDKISDDVDISSPSQSVKKSPQLMKGQITHSLSKETVPQSTKVLVSCDKSDLPLKLLSPQRTSSNMSPGTQTISPYPGSPLNKSAWSPVRSQSPISYQRRSLTPSRQHSPHMKSISPSRLRSITPIHHLSPRQRTLSPRSPRKRSLSPNRLSLSPKQRSRSPWKKSLSPSRDRLRSTSPSHKNISSRKRSISPYRQISPRRRSISPLSRALSPRRRSGSPFKRALSPPRRAVSPRRRSVSPSRRPASPRRRSDLALRRPISPRRRSVSPSRRPLSPRRRSVSPSRRQLSPRRRSVSSARRAFSPRRRSISPTIRYGSPRRRSGSPLPFTSQRQRSITPPRRPLSSNKKSVSPRRHANSPIRDERRGDRGRDYRGTKREDNRRIDRNWRDRDADKPFLAKIQNDKNRNIRKDHESRIRRSRSHDKKFSENSVPSKDSPGRHKKVSSRFERSKSKEAKPDKLSLPQVDLDKIPAEERAKIEARMKKFSTTEVKIDPAKKVSLKSIKERSKKRKKSKDQEGADISNAKHAKKRRETGDNISQLKKRKESTEKKEETSSDDGNKKLAELEDESDESDSGRAWRQEGNKSTKAIHVNSSGKSNAALISLDRIQVISDDLRTGHGRGDDWQSRRRNLNKRPVERRQFALAGTRREKFVSDEEEESNKTVQNRLTSSIATASSFMGNKIHEKLRIELQVTPKEKKQKKKVKSKPDFSHVYSVPAKRQIEEEVGDDKIHLPDKKLKKKDKEKRKKNVKEIPDKRALPSSVAVSGDQQTDVPIELKTTRPSVLERLGKKVPLKLHKEKKKKKKKKKFQSDDEDSSELDVKIQKIKEKNAAIARRQQEIELDKVKYG